MICFFLKVKTLFFFINISNKNKLAKENLIFFFINLYLTLLKYHYIKLQYFLHSISGFLKNIIS